jgi:DNA-binding MarR family transcriptional regulator
VTQSRPRPPAPAAGPGDAALELDNQLCFLIYRLQRNVTDLYRPILAEMGLTYPQYLVMLALWETDGLTVGELGAQLHLDSGTLSPLLKRLESAGMVSRSRRASDERVVVIHLTTAGSDLRARARTVPETLGRCLNLDPGQYQQYHSWLTGLVTRLDQILAPGSVPRGG